MNKNVFDNLKVDQNLEETFTTFKDIFLIFRCKRNNVIDITSFEIEFVANNGKSVKYNSETKIMISNKGEIINISKLLTIILTIYLL